MYAALAQMGMSAAKKGNNSSSNSGTGAVNIGGFNVPAYPGSQNNTLIMAGIVAAVVLVLIITK